MKSVVLRANIKCKKAVSDEFSARELRESNPIFFSDARTKNSFYIPKPALESHIYCFIFIKNIQRRMFLLVSTNLCQNSISWHRAVLTCDSWFFPDSLNKGDKV